MSAPETVVFSSYAERHGAAVYDAAKDHAKGALFSVSLQSTLDYLRLGTGQRNGEGKAFAAVAGYLDLMTPNAVADRHDGCFVLGFHQSLFVTIVEFCLFAFAQRDISPDIGNAADEASPVVGDAVLPGLMLLEHTWAGAQVDALHDAARVPQDPDRHVLAIYTALLMARFAWLHELAHCFRGHVDLARATGIAQRLHELEVAGFAETEQTALGPRWLVQRALEFDADSTALLMSADIQLNGQENIDGIAALPLDLRLQLVQFAAYGFASLLEALQSRLNRRVGLTHPKPPARLRNLLLTTSAIPMPETMKETTSQALHDVSALGAAMPALDLMRAIRMVREPDDLSATQHMQAVLEAALSDYRYGPRSG